MRYIICCDLEPSSGQHTQCQGEKIVILKTKSKLVLLNWSDYRYEERKKKRQYHIGWQGFIGPRSASLPAHALSHDHGQHIAAAL
jgi:hypothetical protein